MRYALPISVLVVCLLALAGCESEKSKAPASKSGPPAGGKGGGAVATEAKQNLRAIGTGAEAYFQSEHVDPENPMVAVNNTFPVTDGSVCSAGGDGGTTDPSETAWGESPWKDLGFSVSGPHRFSYCYDASEDGKRFTAWAETDSAAFCLRGEGSANGVKLFPIIELKADQYCEF